MYSVSDPACSHSSLRLGTKNNPVHGVSFTGSFSGFRRGFFRLSRCDKTQLDLDEMTRRYKVVARFRLPSVSKAQQ